MIEDSNTGRPSTRSTGTRPIGETSRNQAGLFARSMNSIWWGTRFSRRTIRLRSTYGQMSNETSFSWWATFRNLRPH